MLYHENPHIIHIDYHVGTVIYLMLIPVYLGASFYAHNKAELEYSKNLHVKQVIDRVNDIGELPILTIAGDVLNSTSTAKQSVGTAVEILNRMNVISKQVKEDIKIIKNIRALTDSLVKPIDEVTDLLNDKNRQMVHDIVEKINRMLKTLTDDEINQVLTKVTAVAGSAEKFLSPENRNMTNHVLKDSDIALERVNKLLGKFT